MEIDRLELHISDNADQTAASLFSLADALDKLGQSLDKVNLQAFDDQLKQTTQSFSEFSDSLKELEALKSVAGDIADTLSSADVSELTDGVEEVTDAVDGLSEVVSELGTDLDNLDIDMEDINIAEFEGLDEAKQGVKELTQNLSEVSDEAVEAGNTSRSFGDAVKNIVTPALSKFKELSSTAFSGLISGLNLARRALGPLVAALGSALSVLGKFAKQMGVAATASAASLFPIRQIASVLKRTFLPNMEKSTSGLVKFASSLKRILLYRTVRKLLSEIAKAFKEGTQNVYQYSKIVGTDLAGSLDKIATSFSYLKNAVGSVAAPIINILAPAIDFLIDKFVALLNIVAQFFAVLSGSSVYSKAVKNQVEWADAVGGTEAAIKNLTGSIDELNILSDSAGGGGGGLDFGSMFEEAPVDFFDSLDSFDSIPEFFYDLGRRIAQAIADVLAAIDWEAVKEKARVVAESIAQFINGFIDTPELWYQLGRTLGEGLNTAFTFLLAFSETLKWEKLGQMLAYGLNTAIMFWDPRLAAEAIYTSLNGITSLIYAFFTDTNWEMLGAKFATSLNDIIDGVEWDRLGRTLVVQFTALIRLLGDVISGFNWAEFGQALAQAITGMFNEIPWEKLGKTLADAFNGIFTTLGEIADNVPWAGIASRISQGLTNMINGVDWSNAGETLGKLFNSVLDFIGTIIDQFPWSDIGRNIATFINNSIQTANWSGLGATLGNIVKGILDTLGNLISTTNWQSIGNAIADAFRGIDYSGIISALAYIVGAAIGAIPQLLYGVVQGTVTDVIDYFANEIEAAGGNVAVGLYNGIEKGLGDAKSWARENIANPITQGFADAIGLEGDQAAFFVQAGSKSMTSLAFGLNNNVFDVLNIFIELFDEILEENDIGIDDVKAAWEPVASWFGDFVQMPVHEKFKILWAAVTDDSEYAWEEVSDIWSVVRDWFADNVTIPTEEDFANALENIALNFVHAWENIKETWNVVTGWFADTVINPVKEKFDEFLTNLKENFTGAWDGIRSVWEQVTGWFDSNIIVPLTEAFTSFVNNIVGVFESMGNSIVTIFENAVNAIIRALNSIRVRIPSWVPGIGGKSFELNIPSVSLPRFSIPRFENGGFPESGQLFMARENGSPEFVGQIGSKTAVANNDQIVQSIATAVRIENQETNRLLIEQNQYLSKIAQKDDSIRIGDETIYRSSKRGERSAGYSMGNTVLG